MHLRSNPTQIFSVCYIQHLKRSISVEIGDINGFYARFDDSKIKRKYPEDRSIEDVTPV